MITINLILPKHCFYFFQKNNHSFNEGILTRLKPTTKQHPKINLLLPSKSIRQISHLKAKRNRCRVHPDVVKKELPAHRMHTWSREVEALDRELAIIIKSIQPDTLKIGDAEDAKIRVQQRQLVIHPDARYLIVEGPAVAPGVIERIRKFVGIAGILRLEVEVDLQAVRREQAGQEERALQQQAIALRPSER